MSRQTDEQLPLYHRDDLGTEQAAAETVRPDAATLRKLARLLLGVFGHTGVTATEFWQYCINSFAHANTHRPSYRPRLTEMTNPKYCDGEPFAIKTIHTRPNDRGNAEAVYVRRTDTRECCYAETTS